MSVEILKYDLGSDSLLKFVYGPDGAFAFQSFGQPDIIYTDDIALVKGFVMDSSGRKDLPVVLTLRFDSDQWLLSRFEIDTAGRDSL